MSQRYGYNVQENTARKRPIIYSIDSSGLSDQNNYTIDLTSTYRDVTSIELAKAVVPNPDSDNYLTIKIVGMDSIDGNTSYLDGAFCTIERTASAASPLVYQRYGDHNKLYTHYFDQPIKLNKLQITFLRPNGTRPDFGLQTHFLAFDITTLNQPPL
jgi:hypothetical protein